MIKKILFLFLILITVRTTAQRKNSSSYSFFGIGEEFNIKTVDQASMGGIGAAYSNSYFLNFTNPAAISNLRYATYTLGALNNNLTIKYTGGKQSSSSVNISYIGFGVPIGKKAGLSLGIIPISSVGYFTTNTLLNSEGKVSEIEILSGNGNANKLYSSFGIKLTKELSVGIEGGFIFGNIQNLIINQKTDVQFATKHEQTSVMKGATLKIGLQYKKKLKNNLRIDAGSVFKLSNTLKVTAIEKLSSITLSETGFENHKDTFTSNEVTGSFKSPFQTTIGIGLGKTSKWYAAFEYEYQNAIETDRYSNQFGKTFSYEASNRISIGGFYIPKINSISNYWQRVTYRAGIRFEKTGLLVNGTTTPNNFTAINDYGMSFGVGLPLGKKLSNINLGFEYGKKGTTNNNLIEENYFNIRLSLSLNDINWFIQRQID